MELEAIKTLLICFPEFKISYIPRTQNEITNFLVKTIRSSIENCATLVILFRIDYLDHFKIK